MRTIKSTTLLLLIVFTGCTKYGNYGSTENTVWEEGGEEYYNNVIDLQTNAVENYSSWAQTMDSLEAIKKLQQFFLDDTTVTSATIGSQGIAVQYSNGIRGGVLINPQDGSLAEPQLRGSFPKSSYTSSNSGPVVTNKKAITLLPNYFQWKDYTDEVLNNFSTCLPKAGFTSNTIYKNQDATVDRFTKLAGHGIVYIDSHGFAWPSFSALSEVFLLSGEVENGLTSLQYFDEMIDQSLVVLTEETKMTRYWISPKFIMSHNDFSKDTVLFIGGFCYSMMGNWPDIRKEFAAGTYFGYDFSVRSIVNKDWVISLMSDLCDTMRRPPDTPLKWLSRPNPEKFYYWFEQSTKTEHWVHILYTGDPNLTLWKVPESTFTYAGRTYKYKTFGTQTWMTENLAYLPTVYPIDSSSSEKAFYYVYGYNGLNVDDAKKTDNYQKLGVLYNWNAAFNSCPPGWHLPSEEEVLTFVGYLSNNGFYFADSFMHSDIAKAIASTSGWSENNVSGTPGNNPSANNRSGFNILPGGYLKIEDTRSFERKGWASVFWMNGLKEEWWPRAYSIQSDWPQLKHQLVMFNTSALSVRCVKDKN